MTIKNLFLNPITAIIITIISIAFYLSLLKSDAKYEKSRQIIADLNQNIIKIASDINLLEDKVTEVNSEYYQEKIIRNELLMQKEGEYTVQVIVGESTNTETIPDQKPPEPIEKWREIIMD